MSALVPYSPDQPSRSHSRRVGRTLSGLEVRTRVENAHIEAAAEVQATRADAIAYVARRGLQNVAMLTQLEQQLATLVPLASGRLAAIGDMASLAIAEVVTDTSRRVR